MSAIKAVLWDADGVLQEVPGGWRPLLNEAIGPDRTEALLAEVWPVAKEAMCGRGDLVAELDRLLVAQGLSDAADRIKEVWGTFTRFDDTRALVARLRASGVGCHLATNQDPLRADYMRRRLGYDDVMDSCFYSCDVGAAKPSGRYFTQVLAALDLRADQVAFVDDTEVNVVAAGKLGIASVHWHHREGLPALVQALRGLGLDVG